MIDAKPQGALVQVLGNPQKDVHRLRRWHEAPPTYEIGQTHDPSWQHDSKSGIVGRDASGKLFEAASKLLLTYDYYPQTVMHTVSSFGLEDRPMQVGDRILLRIHVLRIADIGVLDALAINRVVEVTQSERLTQIAYITTTRHSEMGIWYGKLEWDENESVRITVTAWSKPIDRALWPVKKLARLLQKRAWKLGMAHFIEGANRAVSD